MTSPLCNFKFYSSPSNIKPYIYILLTVYHCAPVKCTDINDIEHFKLMQQSLVINRCWLTGKFKRVRKSLNGCSLIGHLPVCTVIWLPGSFIEDRETGEAMPVAPMSSLLEYRVTLARKMVDWLAICLGCWGGCSINLCHYDRRWGSWMGRDTLYVEIESVFP